MCVMLCINSIAQEVLLLPDDLFETEWRQSETRLIFMRSGEIQDVGIGKMYKIESVTKPGANYIIIASNNNYYVKLMIGTDKIVTSNALMISYDPSMLFHDFNEAMNSTNGRVGWLYREKP